MGSPASTAQTSNSTSQPWAPAVPALTNLIGSASGLNTSVTPGQTGALNTLTSAASGLPNFGAQAGDLASYLFRGGGATGQTGMVGDAYNQLRSQLGGTADPSSINPYTNPVISGALHTMGNDITNSINGQWAAAGRSGSPGNSQALARGLAQGQSGIVLDQYNKNLAAQMGAAGNLYGAGNSTAGLLSGMNQQGVGNMLSGMGVAGAQPGVALAPGMAQFGVANQSNSLPFQNLGMLSGLINPIAALGGQTQGNQNTTQSQSTAGNILGGALGGAGALSSLFSAPAGGTSAIAGLSSFLPSLAMLSDRRAKDDIHKIGLLNDATPVYSFRYKGDPRTQIGLMAQDVEKTRPDAVQEIAGPGSLKAVDYAKATESARELGMLKLAA